MATPARRHISPLIDMLDWIRSESALPGQVFSFPGQVLGRMPAIEDYIDADTYVLRAELAGVDPEKDIHVAVDGDQLTIEGTRREETRAKGHQEFRYGSFSRTVTLPRRANVEGISAEYRSGVLEVRVPLNPGGDEPRRIEVKNVQ